MPNLAISLHATTDEQREMLVPVNRKRRRTLSRLAPHQPVGESASRSVRPASVNTRRKTQAALSLLAIFAAR